MTAATQTDIEGDKAKAPLTNRSQAIRDVCKEISALEEERKVLGANISKVKKIKVKGYLGLKISDFNVALRLYGMEQDDRDEMFRTMRETFKALGVGKQSSFLDAMDDADRSTGEDKDLDF